MSTVNNRKDSKGIVYTPASLKFARSVANGLHADNTAGLLAQNNHAVAFGNIIDSILLQLQQDPAVAIVYDEYKSTRAQVIYLLQQRKDDETNPGFGYKESTATKVWQDFWTWATRERDIETPRAPSKSAQINAKVRADLLELSDEELTEQKITASTNEDYTRAKQIKTELDRRTKVDEQKIKNEDGKALTAVKTSLKKWIGKLTVNEVASLQWLKSNPEQFAKIVKLSSKSK